MLAALSLNGGLLFIVQFCINNIFVIFGNKCTETELKHYEFKMVVMMLVLVDYNVNLSYCTQGVLFQS